MVSAEVVTNLSLPKSTDPETLAVEIEPETMTLPNNTTIFSSLNVEHPDSTATVAIQELKGVTPTEFLQYAEVTATAGLELNQFEMNGSSKIRRGKKPDNPPGTKGPGRKSIKEMLEDFKRRVQKPVK